MSMTFEEFLKKLNKSEYWSGSLNEESKLEVTWSLGGLSGGSCWDEGDAVYYAESGSPEPDFESFDKALGIICCHLGFLQYKEIKQKVVEFSEKTHHEYYGNYSKTGRKTVKLKNLYDELIEKEVI